MTDDETTDLIEQYLLGWLDTDAHRAVEQRIREDAPFRETVAFQQALIRQARHMGRQDLRNRLRDIATQPESADAGGGRVIPLPTRRTGQPWSYTAIAASVALLVLAGVWLGQTGQPDPVVSQVRPADPAPRLVRVPFEAGGASAPAMGFAGRTDSTTAAVLIYNGQPTQTGSVRRYRFDDTLRLYGRFDLNRLSLRYDGDRDQYALRVDTVTYPLQRYVALQPLH